jgi:hypothetical protein
MSVVFGPPPLPTPDPPDWVAYEHGIRIGPSRIDGRGVFATQDLKAGTTVLIESGISATEKAGKIGLHLIFSPSLFCALAPRDRVTGTWEDMLHMATHKARINKFTCEEDEMERGAYFYHASVLLRSGSLNKEQTSDIIARFRAIVPLDFVSYNASMFNGARNADEMNTTYGFLKRREPEEPACIFFVTRRDVSEGEELLIPYGKGSEGVAQFGLPGEEAVDEAIRAHQAVKDVPYTVTPRTKAEIGEAKHLASAFSDTVDDMFSFTTREVQALTAMAEEYRRYI